MQQNSPLHLIVEGTDKTGKTTVCTMLSNLLDLPLIKMSDMPKYFDSNPEEASEIFNKCIVQFAHTAFIMDRGFPTSLVYSKFFGRTYDLSYIHKDIIPKLNARVYVLDVSPRESDNILNTIDQDKLRTTYLNLADKYDWIVLPCTGQTPEQICATIIKDLKPHATI